MSLYAQHGYGKSNKIDEGLRTKSLSGIILSPKNEKLENLSNYVDFISGEFPDAEILFDPQLYVAAFQGVKKEGNLKSYKYYPSSEVGKNYLSVPKNIRKIVDDCLQYQSDIGVNKFISPSILMDNFDSRWSQISLSLASEAIDQMDKPSDELLLTICVDENAFKNLELVKDYLDAISLFDVKGFYILIDRINTDTPNDIDPDILINIMYFCHNLALINGYEVIVGYCDLIGLPLYCTGIRGIASGWHNTLRRFSRQDYVPRTGGKQPNKRYLSMPLLARVQINPQIVMLNETERLDSILSNMSYDGFLLADITGADWSSIINCLHNWEVLSNIMQELDSHLAVDDKIDILIAKLGNAHKLAYNLTKSVFNESMIQYSYLKIWAHALKEFRRMVD